MSARRRDWQDERRSDEDLKKREQRHAVLVPARMRVGNDWVDVCIRNISSRGMLIETGAPPPAGTYIEIRRARHVIVARAVWRREGRFGVRTQDRLDIPAIVAATAGVTQGRTPEGLPERRIDPVRRNARAAQSAERSRQLGARLQFLSIAAIGVAAAAYGAAKVYQLLADSFSAISEHL